MPPKFIEMNMCNLKKTKKTGNDLYYIDCIKSIVFSDIKTKQNKNRMRCLCFILVENYQH